MNKHFRWLSLLSLSLVFSAQSQESAVVDASRLNVRGKPTLRSEVVTQLERGDKVTILEIIPDEDAKPNEPASWAKIKLPENTPVWVFAPFVKEGEVTASRLNLRAGPGERYSVVGRVERGAKVKTIRTVESWMEIEAPDVAYAFVGLNLLDRTGGGAVAAAGATNQTVTAKAAATKTPPTKAAATGAPTGAASTNLQAKARPAQARPAQPAPAGSTGALALPGTRPVESKSAPVAAAPTRRPGPMPGAPGATNVSSAVAARPDQPEMRQAKAAPARPDTNVVSRPSPGTAPGARSLPEARPEALPEVAAGEEEAEPRELPKRVVRREGFVQPTRSIQAPTAFELVSPTSGKAINYLFGDEVGVSLGQFRDMKVVVTGEEGIDERWPNTPVLKIETIDTAP